MGDTVVLDGELSLEVAQDAELGIITKVREGDYPFYAGATEVTPSTETQRLETAETIVLSNIVINPIPSNYGLITWNGSVLTVS